MPEGDPVPEGELDAAGEPEPDPDPDPDGEGEIGVLVGELLGLVPVGEGEVEDTDGVGVGVFEGVGVDVGVGVGVLAVGSTVHWVSVFAPALVEVPGLAEAAAAFTVSARAAPGQAASIPRIRKPPASTLSTAARTCARCMKFALSTLIIGVTVCSSGIRRRLGDGWV